MVEKANGPNLKEAPDRKAGRAAGTRCSNSSMYPRREKKCEASDGIIGEAKEHMEDIEDEQVLDAGIISSAQAVEHCDICHYADRVGQGFRP